MAPPLSALVITISARLFNCSKSSSSIELVQLVMESLFVYFILGWNKIQVFIKSLKVSLESFFCVKLIICPAGSD